MSQNEQTTAALSNTPDKDRKHHPDREHKLTQKNVIRIIGDIASIMSVIMYVSYIPQIAANFSGNPGVPWQPLAALFNCIFWFVYGFWSKPKLWPVVIANFPGIFLAGITFITCFIH